MKPKAALVFNPVAGLGNAEQDIAEIESLKPVNRSSQVILNVTCTDEAIIQRW